MRGPDATLIEVDLFGADIPEVLVQAMILTLARSFLATGNTH